MVNEEDGKKENDKEGTIVSAMAEGERKKGRDREVRQ